jgi:hypothetical protein
MALTQNKPISWWGSETGTIVDVFTGSLVHLCCEDRERMISPNCAEAQQTDIQKTSTKCRVGAARGDLCIILSARPLTCATMKQ